MKKAWKNISSAECSRKKCKCKQQKQKEQNELHEMIMKQVQQMMKDMFKQPHQHHRSDDNSDIDKAHHIEEMENIMVSECFNLSDLHQPPTKKTKTQDFAPITTALLEMHLGKSSRDKIRVLFDSGSSGSIIVAKFVKKLHIQNDTKTEWWTKGGTFHMICMMTTRLACNRAIESSYWRMDNHSDVGLLMGYVLYQLPIELQSMDLDTFPR
jgi:hypothetical protein